MANEMGRDRDLVLAPGEFAFVLDTTKGLVNTIVGPNKISMSNTDQPVVWDKAGRKFVRVDAEKAVQTNSIAPEGFYIALFNPSADEKTAHPREGSSSGTVPLSVGHRVNVHGPIHFPLWPGQMANVIQGHHLRSNQYLLAQVYNDAEATSNWPNAVMKPQGDGETPAAVATPRNFAPGQLIIIKGTDVAFFMPPTGVKVVPEAGTKVFVREAVTLERLEYCILLDEDGNKRFVQGPDVVFPEPSEQFITKDGSRKFRAIELNPTSGIYVKVIADYEEDDPRNEAIRVKNASSPPNAPKAELFPPKHYKTGDELFITGAEQAIYFQREEHSVIRYDDQTKHYAVAVPAGEGRYVLNRTTGVVSLVKGPKMLLCDPRTEVIVRRVLAEKTARLWYPNNERVVEINQALFEQSQTADASQYMAGRPMASSMSYATPDVGMPMAMAAPASRQIAGDQFKRGTSFTPPRTITLDTKYEGAVSISVWTGYAVLVIDKTGHRRVVVGPETFLLEYDETLAPLELSTGKPKTDTNLLRTVYLRVQNNKVSDIIRAETKDLVNVNLAVSYRVNFEGEHPEQWFAVENYVQLLADHMRSLIRNAVKRKNIEEFYANPIDIIRDSILGEADTATHQRAGRLFTENNMRVYDVEVLDVKISDQAVAALLLDAQSDALSSAIKLSKQERALLVTQRSEQIKQLSAKATNETVLAMSELTQLEIAAQLQVALGKIVAESEAEKTRLTNKTEQSTLLATLTEAELARAHAIELQEQDAAKVKVELELKRMLGETEEIVKRAGAINPTLAAALTTFADHALIEKISVALAPMASMAGVSVADVLSQLFKGTPFEGVMKQLGTRSSVLIEQ